MNATADNSNLVGDEKSSLMSVLLQRNYLLMAGGVAVLGVVLSLVVPSLLSGKVSLEPIEMALQYLEEGDLQAARRVAESYKDNYRVDDELQGIPSYVMGASAHQEAEHYRNPRDKQRIHLLAAQHLEIAHQTGFPKGNEAMGLYLLGRSLYMSEQFQKCIPVLIEAYKLDFDHQLEIEELLASAFFEAGLDDQVNLEEALVWIDRYLENKTVSIEDRELALAQKSRIQYQLGNTEAALKTLEEIPATSPRHVDSLIMQGLVIYDQVKEKKTQEDQPVSPELQKAIEMFRTASNNQLVSSDSTRKASYLLGASLLLSGDKEGALEQSSRTRKIYFRTPESIAAGLQEAELLKETKRHDEAVDIYQRILKEAGDETNYRNPWLSLDDFNIRVTAAIEDYSEPKLFHHALALSQSLSPLFPKEQSLESQGNVLTSWGASLEEEADEVRLAEAKELRKQARLRFRQAGHIYRQLAKSRFTKETYPEALWNSANSYIHGQDFSKAVEILSEYRQNETRTKKPRSLVALARALIDLDRATDALEPLLECIEFYPKNPSTYRARLLAAESYLELGELNLAKEILQNNLDDGDLEPSSQEWEESLFALGRVLHLEGELLEAEARVKGISEEVNRIPKEAFDLLEKSNESYRLAIRNLHNAVRRYPNAEQATMSRYLIAECHRRSSMLPKKKYRLVNIETQRVKFDKQVKDHLETALDIYKELEDELTEVYETKGELHPVDAQILRNSYFAQGAVYYELQRYEDAIEAYSTASNSYQNEAVAIEAFLQIAHCYRYKNQPREAKAIIEQAKKILAKLPPEADYSETSQDSLDDWERFLNWFSSAI